MVINNIYMLGTTKFLRNSFFSLGLSLLVSAMLHVMLIVIIYATFSVRSSMFLSEVQENVVLVDMIDVKEYTNLTLKLNKDDVGEAVKKYSTITKKIDEVDQEKTENTVKATQKVPVDNSVKKETQLKKSPDFIINKPKSAAKPAVKILKPSVKPKVKVEEELGSLLKSMDLVKTSVKNTSKGSEDGLIGKGELGNYDNTKPISQSVLSTIKSQFMRCWTVPVSTFEVKGIKVVVRIVLDKEGSVEHVYVVNAESYKNNEYFQIMASSAVQAVYKCNPITGLPKESYTIWREMELNFDPVDML